jgi:hypothetical protein
VAIGLHLSLAIAKDKAAPGLIGEYTHLRHPDVRQGYLDLRQSAKIEMKVRRTSRCEAALVRLPKRVFNMNRLLSLGAALLIVLEAAALCRNSEYAPDVSPRASQPEHPKTGREQEPTESSELTLYDSDPKHLWNRLHQALHVRLTELGNPERTVTPPIRT